MEIEPTNELGSMYYYASLIAIFSFLQNTQGTEKGEHSQYEHYGNVLLSSAREISHLMEIQCSTWGIQSFPSFGMEWVTSALFALLNDVDDPKSREALVNLFGTAALASRRWERGKDMLQAVRLAVEQRGMALLAEVSVSEDNQDSGHGETTWRRRAGDNEQNQRSSMDEDDSSDSSLSS
jgi:hypothetical protein